MSANHATLLLARVARIVVFLADCISEAWQSQKPWSSYAQLEDIVQFLGAVPKCSKSMVSDLLISSGVLAI